MIEQKIIKYERDIGNFVKKKSLTALKCCRDVKTGPSSPSISSSDCWPSWPSSSWEGSSEADGATGLVETLMKPSSVTINICKEKKRKVWIFPKKGTILPCFLPFIAGHFDLRRFGRLPQERRRKGASEADGVTGLAEILVNPSSVTIKM